ncbi:TlpA family protein disulfide reductase [Nocardioides sp. Kera G14]|uniref:TlpA family protein disulfide reductase n=1 Tax=Nocardioides sp. Kera G14 TaxID=2884264 RepID=UPI001D111ECF|nr:TlpA disulfide reductase family protein [Nocardioides sp. Kera G14]UDY23752.1 TlpA family protein disulfide reductase [Nocardioides sp. Kera G14]
MGRVRMAAGAAVLLLTLVGCGGPSITAPKEKDIRVDTPELVALKKAAGIESCPTSQTSRGGLPDVTLKCLGGGADVDLSTLKGPLVINVWSSTCGPCRQEMPALGEFHRKYGSQVPLLGIDIEDTYPGVALKQAAKRKASYPQLFDYNGHIDKTKTLHLTGLPTFFFLHADGTVTKQAGGLESLDEVVDMVNTQLGMQLS